MKKNILLITCLSFILFFLSACAAGLIISIPKAPFSRGINMANALEAPIEGEWGVVIQDWFFPEIAAKGFDVVRIPVGWHYHITEDTSMTIDDRFFERVEQIFNQAISTDLKVILSFHSFDDLYDKPLKNEPAFKKIWEQIVNRFSGQYPESLFFELLNEPHGNLSAEIWNRIQLETINLIRDADPERWIIITGADWGDGKALSEIQLSEDSYKILGTFHMYEPYLFTHQNVPWLDDAYSTTGVVWPGPPAYYIGPSEAASNYPAVVKWFEDYNKYAYIFNPAGPTPITEEMHKAMRWSKNTGIPVFLGEFGTYEQIDQQSRVNWTHYVRRLAEDMDISWIYWDFAGHFEIFDLNTVSWNNEIADALGLISRGYRFLRSP